MKRLLITICARGGSKGIPKKNIRLLGKKHLISYTINHAFEIKKWFESENNFHVDIELSTDSNEIKAVAELYDLKTNYLRPEYLANDEAGKLPVIKDVLLYSETNNPRYDIILDLDVSAPMRTQKDLKEGFKLIDNNPDAKNLFSVSNAAKNPYFNMVEKGADGFYSLSKKTHQILSRQKAPKVYDMNASFYYYKREFFDTEDLILFTNSLIFEMDHVSFDLDHIIEFEFLEFLVTNNKLNFKI